MAYPRLRARFFVNPRGQVAERAKRWLPTHIREEVFERDNQRCQLCGRRVRMGGLYDNPFDLDKLPCGAIDHILPISRGGQHDPKNLRVACKRCNSGRKAAVHG